jgi:hypothetical protein
MQSGPRVGFCLDGIGDRRAAFVRIYLALENQYVRGWRPADRKSYRPSRKNRWGSKALQSPRLLDLLKMGKGGYLRPKRNYSDAENEAPRSSASYDFGRVYGRLSLILVTNSDLGSDNQAAPGVRAALAKRYAVKGV